jgi:hypothetical protein
MSLDSNIVVEKRYGVTGDAIFPGIGKQGYIYHCVTFENITTNAAQISMGFTAAGTEICAQKAIQPSGITYVSLGGIMPSVGAETSIYLHTGSAGDTWNSATVNVFITMEKGNII